MALTSVAMPSRLRLEFALASLCLLVLPSACGGFYYAAMEKLGKEKRDILVGRVKEIREDQAEAKEQFQTTLEAFQALTGFKGGELEKVYKRLDKEYERSVDRAKDVSNRIRSIEKVAGDLFKEWGREAGEISDASLRRRSETLMGATKKRYEVFASKLHRTEEKMAPVLQVFHDQVLFLKHNLNAQAIDSLRDTVIQVDGDVGDLVRSMEESIQEADDFIASMSSP